MDKVVASARAAIADVRDGATVMVGGFGVVQGWPRSLLDALRDHGARDLTIIANTPGVGPTSPQMLAEAGLVRKLIASYAVYPKQRTPMDAGIRSGRIELELVPQGTLVERIRAGGAGLAGFYTPTGADTEATRDREVREFGGRRYVLETALRADFALVRAATADRYGNLVYRRGSRNFNPVMATAAGVTVAEVDAIVAAGALDPEAIVTPGVWVDRVVRCEQPLDVAALRELSRRWGRQWDLEARERASGPRGIPPDLMVRRVARLLAPGEYVNLGLGLPTLVSNALEPAQDVTLHSENGMLGFGSLAEAGEEEDIHCYNASGQLVRQRPGASYFDAASAFAMARSGRVTTVVLGAFQVSRRGDLANWNVPSSGVGGIGGAMDLASGAARVVVVMFHVTRDGLPKLVERCTYPLTAVACVRTVVTDLALIDVEDDGFLLRELAPGVRVDDVRQVTGAPLRIAPDVGEMRFA
jgi:3-oxoacid CoA-transferase